MKYTVFLRLLIIPVYFNLQGCVVAGLAGVAGVSEKSGAAMFGPALFIAGMGIVYVGYKLATKTVLEQWSVKLLKVGALVLLLG